MTKPKDLIVSLVQANLVWENKDENLLHLRSLIDQSKPSTDLIVLPEMFSTGFSMNARFLAENNEGNAVQWLKNLAKDYNCVCTGSLITEESGKYFNRLYWVRPDGSFEKYDKRHLFSFANEHDHYSSGNERLIVELKGWRICPLICYDLRFPVWSRNTKLPVQTSAENVYDLLIYVANWPEARRKPWNNLLEARAHENQTYVVGVNRVGKDGNGINYAGDSTIYDPKGDMISELNPFDEGVFTGTLSYSDLKSFREKFTAWKDKDLFDLQS